MYSRIAIVGAGAIGTYYGARLALAGAEVRFLLRSDLAAVRARGSIRLQEKAGVQELSPVITCGTPAEVGPVDLIIVTLKTTANDALAHLLPPMLGPETVIFTLQNGLGSDEQLAARFGAERVMGGLAFIAANRTAPGEIRCFHPGLITLGEFERRPLERTRRLALQLEAAGVKTHLAANLLEARWRKLVWNIPFNGLAIARGGLTTDRLCGDPALAEEVRVLMREVQAAAAGFGFSIPDEFLREQFDKTPPLGAYPPSSLLDFQAGREVEIESIWGEPLRRARQAGVVVPRLARLYAEVLAACGGNLA